MRRADAHELFRRLGVVPHIVLHRIEHADVIVYKLQHVLIARDDHHLKALFHRAASKRSDYVVRLEPCVLEHRNSHGFESAADPRNLFQQVGWRFGAVGFIGCKRLVAKRGPLALKNRGQVLRLLSRSQAPHHVVKNVHRFRGDSSGGAHRRSPRAGPCVVGAKDEPKRINQKELGHSFMVKDW